jgi:hypothetical protein
VNTAGADKDKAARRYERFCGVPVETADSVTERHPPHSHSKAPSPTNQGPLTTGILKFVPPSRAHFARTF